MKCTLKWKPIKQEYANSTRTCILRRDSHHALVAFSYGWWKFFGRAPNGEYVFSNHSYSVTTTGHQSAVRVVLRQSGISYREFDMPRGVDNPDAAILEYISHIRAHEQAMAKKGSRKAKNAERRDSIAYLSAKIRELREVYGLVSGDAEAFKSSVEASLDALAS